MTPHLPPALSLQHLGKSFGDHVVLDGIDLNIAAGTVFSLLGPNGAGKTTLVRILATLSVPDQGAAHVFGHDVAVEPEVVRRLIGVTGQYSAVDDVLTGVENLHLTGKLLHLDRAEIRRRTAELLERFDLTDAGGRRAGTYSGGMRRRLDLAMSLMGDPRIVFLDEPTTGLDPRSRRDLWQVIQRLAADGTTIFLTTQYLEEANQLADRVAVLDGGKLVADGTPDELKQLAPGGHIRLRFADRDLLAAAARAIDDRVVAAGDHALVDIDQLTLQVPSDGNAGDVKRLLNRFDDLDIAVDQLTVHLPDLDDVFFALTGHPTHAESAA
ncbi:ATP-binding cassette domain-containing protein [Nocardia cyriacigeorgica]|uniref:ATP-binding cassette domain-containing protein n=1 Tax=Nocardia cyriacigeorgica TaxID=135487 RepID=A0A6P1DCU9_9NOCA|nr:ATP-binding cassette domain-containing protein [Nocardia cyriacigeorgica]NEW41967.1 ATP-binding cassette domain-containing protein [Nocardia cyriacigeorgica]NEW46984.1 ATP-binding cassette domain-containing protein [Nocardia cyriacigeorgica]NEW53003.1 ATP-binding cassette domain-containing protein [Nocardia cyriacigeorgica]NEW57101.1 ATP-binding cassette domain-containing protein [Nocardia cyriacigeorgica]